MVWLIFGDMLDEKIKELYASSYSSYSVRTYKKWVLILFAKTLTAIWIVYKWPTRNDYRPQNTLLVPTMS